MRKDAWLQELRVQLGTLPKAEIEERVRFYSEMIDDRMEDGIDEEAAVADLGAMEDIVAQSLDEVPLHKLVRERIRPKHPLAVWEIVLLAVGSPLWISVFAVAVAVAVSLLAALFAIEISVIAVEASLLGCFIGCMIAGVVVLTQGTLASGLLLLGAALLCAGPAILLGVALRPLARWLIALGKGAARGCKKCFMRKEETK